MTEVAIWWAAALFFLAAGLWMALRPEAVVAFQRRLLERQLALLDRGFGRTVARFSGAVMLLCALLMMLILATGQAPLAEWRR